MQVTINLDERLVQTLFKPGAPINEKTILHALLTYDAMQYVALAEIRGTFSEKEMLLIADVLNGYWYAPANPKQQLLFNVSDGIADDRLDKKWDVDKYALLSKLSSLSQFHAHAVLMTVNQCWEGLDYTETSLTELLRRSFVGEGLPD